MILCLLRSWNSHLQHPPLILPLLGRLLAFPHLPSSRRSTQSPKQRQIYSITHQSIQTTSLHSFHTTKPVLKAIAGHLSELPLMKKHPKSLVRLQRPWPSQPDAGKKSEPPKYHPVMISPLSPRGATGFRQHPSSKHSCIITFSMFIRCFQS